MNYSSKYQSGNVFPLLLVVLGLIGIVAATNLIDIPQIFKSRADYSVLPTGTPSMIVPENVVLDRVSATCDTNGKVSLKWQEVVGSTNYTLRINHYPIDWNPDYTASDAEILTTGEGGDRALEAGNNLSKIVNVGTGFYLGGTVTSTNGTVQAIPEFNCPKKYESCVQSIATACAPDNAVFCRQFPNPCKVPPSWNTVGPTIQPKDGPKLCIQVITYACEDSNPTNCKNFPTPCDVPSGWTKKPSSSIPYTN